ncbi:MAG: hypothetical protein HYS60_02000 [Candidatus Wildermuthbacteria bacterium]|nr:hypothetical protein [Candidatus Wildermuthbacteria bacterium]
MKLLEYQGKELFKKYGIKAPNSVLIGKPSEEVALRFPVVLKSQVPSGARNKKGGIVLVEQKEEFMSQLKNLFQKNIDGVLPEKVLAEEKIDSEKEWYLSISFDTNRRMPVLAISEKGGADIETADIFPLEFKSDSWVLPLLDVSLQLKEVLQSLLNLFQKEHALLAEINPLFELTNGSFVAGDSKVILDDNAVNPQERPYLDLPGDIAILASGGGASLLNLDMLMRHGGKPANYVEYSGNPPASVVEDLTIKVLSKPGLKGCWTVGGTANFTDIYETMLGFAQGLGKVQPKPTYPIVIRRDGPRQKEAFEMLRRVAKEEGFNFHLYGPETSMSESAKIMVQLAYGNSH